MIILYLRTLNLKNPWIHNPLGSFLKLYLYLVVEVQIDQNHKT